MSHPAGRTAWPKESPVSPAVPPLVPKPCDCCGHHDFPREWIRRDGVDLSVCVEPRGCIRRAKAWGLWLGWW